MVHRFKVRDATSEKYHKMDRPTMRTFSQQFAGFSLQFALVRWHGFFLKKVCCEVPWPENLTTSPKQARLAKSSLESEAWHLSPAPQMGNTNYTMLPFCVCRSTTFLLSIIHDRSTTFLLSLIHEYIEYIYILHTSSYLIIMICFWWFAVKRSSNCWDLAKLPRLCERKTNCQNLPKLCWCK